MSERVKLYGLNLDEVGIQVINEFFYLKPDQENTILVWSRNDVATVESMPGILFDALRIALPLVNISVWAGTESEMKGEIIYDLLRSGNTLLMNYYATKDNNFTTCPESSIILNKNDIDKIKEVYNLLIEHNHSQRYLREKSNWKATEWVFALNHYLQACSSRGLEESIVNLITAFEALLVTGHEQVSYRVALNASLLYSDDPMVREETFNLIKDMYGLRSKVVHGEITTFIKQITKPDIYEKYFKLKDVLSALLLKTSNYSTKELHDRVAKSIFKTPPIID